MFVYFMNIFFHGVQRYKLSFNCDHDFFRRFGPMKYCISDW
jgi:hypothetical protein